MDTAYRYMLRFVVDPRHEAQANLTRLYEFCRRARVDDVMFFIAPEELSIGQVYAEDAAPWLEIVAQAKPVLASMGITTSLNPWATLLHCDRGRTLPEGKSFTRMVDPNGQEALSIGCPLDEAFQEHLCSFFASCCQAVHPDTIWVEDDFRLHNHDPLAWGGCFCEKHMAEYARRIGHPVTREDFVRGVLQPGEPHPYRKVWLDTGRDVMAALAQRLGKAVAAVSPETRVALMSSAPQVHCAEGRDWEKVLRGLAQAHTPIDRIHLPAYSETASSSYFAAFNQVSRYTRAVIPEDALVYPELENYPCNPFSKSNRLSRFQIETAALIDAQGITMDIFDFMGNGINFQYGLDTMLAEAKPFAAALAGLQLRQAQQQGVRILVSTQSSYALHTSQGAGFPELYPHEVWWAGILPAYGIPTAYTTDDAIEGQVVALSGQILRTLGAEKARRLFAANQIILDGEAASVLADMGLGMLAGIQGCAWRGALTGQQTYEQVDNGRIYDHFASARLTAQASAGNFLDIQYASGAEIFSHVRDYHGQISGNGFAVWQNRVMILPYDGRTTHILFPARRDMLQDGIRRCFGSAMPMVEDAAHVALYQYAHALVIVNAGSDDLPSLRLSWPGADTGALRLVDREHLQGVPANAVALGETVVLDRPLPSCGVWVILY